MACFVWTAAPAQHCDVEIHKHWPRSVSLHDLIWAVLLPLFEFILFYLSLFLFILFLFIFIFKNWLRHQLLLNSVVCLVKMVAFGSGKLLGNVFLRCMWIDGWGRGGCVERRRDMVGGRMGRGRGGRWGWGHYLLPVGKQFRWKRHGFFHGFLFEYLHGFLHGFSSLVFRDTVE